MIAERTSTRWDQQETRRLVHAVFGSRQLALLQPAQRAVSYRLAHAEYHYREYRRIVKSHIDAKLHAGGDIWDITAPGTDEQAYDTARFYVECEAHLYACVQAVHSVADNLAHAVYYVVGLNLGTDFKGRVSLENIETHLKVKAQTEPNLSAVASLLSGLKTSDAFLSLANLVNQLKHHGGPTVCVSLPLVLGQSYEIQFGDFFRKDGHHGAAEVEKFLGDSHGVVNVAVVEVGIALNHWLNVNSLQKAKSPDEPTEAVAPSRNPRFT